MRPVLLILAAGLLVGCAVSASEPLNEDDSFKGIIRVRVSPKLEEWYPDVVESVAQYNRLLSPKVVLIASLSDEAKGDQFYDYTFDIVPAPTNAVPPSAQAIAVTDMRRGKNGALGAPTDLPRTAVIFVFREDVAPKIRLWNVLHELGHALGLEHDTDKEHLSIMWPFASEPIKLGCEDWRRLRDIWGCDVGCEGQSWL